jgi:hypothetical protein
VQRASQVERESAKRAEPRIRDPAPLSFEMFGYPDRYGTVPQLWGVTMTEAEQNVTSKDDNFVTFVLAKYAARLELFMGSVPNAVQDGFRSAGATSRSSSCGSAGNRQSGALLRGDYGPAPASMTACHIAA